MEARRVMNMAADNFEEMLADQKEELQNVVDQKNAAAAPAEEEKPEEPKEEEQPKEEPQPAPQPEPEPEPEEEPEEELDEEEEEDEEPGAPGDPVLKKKRKN